MNTLLRVLIVEDSPDDAQLLIRELERTDYEVKSERVNNAGNMGKALQEQWDLVVSAYRMPHFSGLEALKLTKQAYPDLPFILFSGKIREETVVELMLAGAADYVLKTDLKRLVPAVRRELRDAEVRRERRQVEEKVRRLNDILLTIRNINQMIVETEDEPKLLQKACQVLIDGRSYKLARIGFIKEGSYDIQPVAQAGFAQGYVDSLKVTWDDSEYGRSPAGMAIKTSKPVLIRDVASDKNYRPWRDLALEYSLSSIIALPLIVGNKVIGMLAVYTEKKDVFDTDEIELLKELAGDISLGIQKIRQRVELNKANEKYTALVEYSNDGMIILQDALVKFSTNHMSKMTGFTSAEYLNRPFLDFVAPAYQEFVIDIYKRRLAGEAVPSRYELELLTKEGGSLPVDVNASIAEYEGKPATMAIIRDITERKKAEEQMRESEKKYHNLVAQSPDGIFIVNLQGVFLSVNKAMCEGLKYSEEELLSMKIWDIVPAQYIELHKKRLADILAGKAQNTAVEYAVRGKDGKLKYIEVLSAPYYEEKELIGFQAIARDITERKQAEATLAENEAKYRSLFENSYDAILLTKPTGEILAANTAACRMFGRTEKEICDVGRNGLIDLTDPRLATALEQRRITGEFSGEMGFIRRDGTKFQGEMTSKMYLDSEGVSKTCMIIRDTTERKRAEEQLRLQAQLLDAQMDAVIVHDDDGNITYVNEASSNVTGYAGNELLKMNINQLTAAKPVAQIPLQTTIPEERSPRTFEIVIQHKNGTTIPAEVHETSTNWQGKRIVLSVLRDISARKHYEEEMTFRAILLDSAIDSIYVWDIDDTLVYVNDAACRTGGFSRDELLGKNIYKLLPQEIAANVRTAKNIIMEKGEFVFESIAIRKDKAILPAEVSSHLITLGGKQYTVAVARDISERKRAEQMLEASEAKYRSIFNTVPISIIVVNKEGIIVDANPYHLQHTLKGKIRLEDYIGENVLQSAGVKQAGMMDAHVKLLQGQPFELNDVQLPPSELGPAININTRGVPIFNGNEITGAVFIQEDITARKQAEEQMKLEAWLLDEANDSIILNGNGGRILYVNEMTCRSLGYTREELLNLKIQQLVTSERLKSIDALLQHTLDKRENLFEDIRVRKDGTQFPIEVHSRVIEFQGQAAILSVSRDITERKQAETQLKFRAQLLDSAMDAIYVLNERGNIVYFNESAHRSRGYTREEMATKRLRDLIAPDFFTSLSAQLNKLMDEKGETTIETTALCKDKSTFPVEIHSRLIKLGDEEFIVNISRNISQRKQAEDDLKKSYEQLEKTYNGVTKVISAAIEIRDPYTAGHQVRVARLAQALAWEMNLAEEQANQIYTAGLIHDIGKINIPAEILSKPGKLNDIEFSLIKIHPQSGYEILKNIEFPYPVARWILEHHERMNGSGYPYGLTADKITLESRIIAVADVVEAMSSHRPYRAALGIDTALAEIRKNKDRLYDGQVVDACLKLFAEKGFKFE